MDVAGSSHYVRSRMEFLLALLSLLTAATGAAAGARVPEAGVHRAAEIVAAAPARQAAPRVLTLLVAPAPQPAEEQVSPADPAPAAAAPLYADRRRE